MGQGGFLNINPNINPNVTLNTPINAPINVNLGSRPRSLGLFAGSAMAFVVSAQIPKGPWKTVAIVAGAAIAAAGVGNLVLGKNSSTPAATPGAPAPAPAPGAPAPVQTATDARGNPITSQAVNVPSQSDLDQVIGSIITPTDTSTVSLWSWQSSYPVQIQLVNPTPNPVSFLLQLSGDETPQPFGSEQVASYAQQVSLAPGETQNLTIQMPTVTWGFTKTYVDVVLTMSKALTAGSPPTQLDYKDFVIS